MDARNDLSRSTVTVILNTRSGRRQARENAALIERRLRDACGRLILRSLRHGRDIGPAAEAAVAAGSDVVAAYGGDGTQSAVAHAVAGTDTAMAVLPGGTFNYFARDLGIDDLDQALAALEGGRIAARDIGTINGRVFLNNASFGLYPRLLQRREAVYRRFGRSRLAAYWSLMIGLRDLTDRMHLTVQTDGQTRAFDTPLAFIARNGLQLDSLGMEGGDPVRAGHFALFVAKGHGKRALLGAALRLAMGRSLNGEDFELVVSDALDITTNRARRLVALDGEKSRLSGPFALQLHPAALRVLVPAPAVPETGPEATP